MTQVGNTILVNASDDNGWGRVGLSLNASAMQHIWITGKLESSNATTTLSVTLGTDLGASVAYANFQIPITTPGNFVTGALTTVSVPFSSAATVDTGFSISNISEWSIGGGANPPGANAFNMTLDHLQLSATAVPEPSTYAVLAGLSALGVAFMRRRKSAV